MKSFRAIQMKSLRGLEGHLGSFLQFLAIFVKSKKRASAPSRERICVVFQLLYRDLKTQPDGTRCKKVIQDFNSTVIMLLIYHILYMTSILDYNCIDINHHQQYQYISHLGHNRLDRHHIRWYCNIRQYQGYCYGQFRGIQHDIHSWSFLQS